MAMQNVLDEYKGGGDDRSSHPLARCPSNDCQEVAGQFITNLTEAPDMFLEQARLSIRCCNPGPRRHRPNNVETPLLGDGTWLRCKMRTLP